MVLLEPLECKGTPALGQFGNVSLTYAMTVQAITSLVVCSCLLAVFLSSFLATHLLLLSPALSVSRNLCEVIDHID